MPEKFIRELRKLTIYVNISRYSFSSRSVIRQDPYLKPDEIRLPFHGLCELLQQVIINILVKTYNFSYAEAYKKWYKAQVTGNDQVVYDIIDGLIKDDPKGGIPFLINRNPTIAYGGILFCRCVGINMDYTMSISLLVLKKLAADSTNIGVTYLVTNMLNSYKLLERINGLKATA